MTSARRPSGSRVPGGRTSAAAGPPRPRLTGRAAVLFLVLGLLVVAYAWPLREYVRQRGDIAGLRADAAAAKARVDELEAASRRWSDPAYVEAQARARLHFVLPGETAYVVLRPRAAAAPQPNESSRPPAADAPPWFAALWGTVRAADGADPPAGR